MVKALHVTVMGEKNYPIETVRVTEEQADLGQIEDLLASARKLNPELSLRGLVQGICRAGVADVQKQIKNKKLNDFLLERRG